MSKPSEYAHHRVAKLELELTALREELSRYQSAEMPESPEPSMNLETAYAEEVNYIDRLEAYCAKLKVEGEQTRARLAEAEKELEGLRHTLRVNIPSSEFQAMCNCGSHRSGELTGGWYCPVHGQQL